MAPTIVIAAGGTAGHVVPALAVADALRAEGAHVVFVGGERAERTMVPEAGYELRPIAVEGLSRSNPLKAARAALQGRPARCGAARRILRDVRPDAVLGARRLRRRARSGSRRWPRRVPLVLAEADSHLGLTNRLLARWARRVCLAFPIDGRDGERYLVTGRPVPPPATDRAAARARFGLGAGRHAACSSSAARWARARSTRRRSQALAGADFRVLHACGRARLRGAARAARPRSAGQLRPARVHHARSARRSLASDLCVARAGGSIFEIAAHGRPAILVPYPHASADHQSCQRALDGRRRARRSSSPTPS